MGISDGASPGRGRIAGTDRLLRPAALRRGARLAVVSPASAARPERVLAGLEGLRELGFKPVLAAHAMGGGPLYYAGTVAERLADLHGAFVDSAIDGIVCTRGGWGSAELLPGLDLDLIASHPKAFLGYSDHTSLQIWMTQQTGLPSFYAPMVSADFARERGVDVPSFRAAISGDDGPWSVGEGDGMRLLRAGQNGESCVEGTLAGGCLSLLTESLGTPFAFAPPPGAILFLEDVGTKPYQWDRMLLHLRLAGVLNHVRGIVFGDMRQCVGEGEDALLEAALLHALATFRGPVCIGLRSGHVSSPNVTLPLGLRVELNVSERERPRLRALEPAVCGSGSDAGKEGRV